MIGAPILIVWIMLCVTYLVFRPLVRRYNIEEVAEAKSPFQPFLAIWGLFWSTLIGKEHSDFELVTLVVLQGFKAFLGPHSPYWSQTDQLWVWQMATFLSIVGFVLLLGCSRLAIGKVAFQYQGNNLAKDEILRGSTENEPETPDNVSKNQWRRAFASLLNYL